MEYLILWLCVMIALVVIEASTVAMVSIYFAVGSLAAMIASQLKAPLWLQILLCIAVGVALLVCTRKWALQHVNSRRVRTNLDRVVGETGMVTEAIENLSGTGAVKVQGKEWSARSEPGDMIAKGTQVRILRIDGVKLWVEPATKSAQ